MGDPVLELDEINTGYGDSHVLHDVSLSVEEEEVVALLGRNGAGKTTTLRSIMGIQAPFSGTVRYRGDDITGQEIYDIADNGIGYVPEERRVFKKLSVREHIVMVADPSYRSVEEELERTYDIFPELERLANRQAENLSGGEQQMLAIARALVGPTDLLLLDEPSEGLAPKIVQTVFETLYELKGDLTILLVEQNYPLARSIADNYYILDQGRVVSEGQIEDLEANEELKEQYLGVH